MRSLPAQLRNIVLAIPPREATFDRRGFQARDDGARHHLERIGRAFLGGYNVAVEDGKPECLAARLRTVDLELRGFAFEGAAMALTILDHLTPWRGDRWQLLLVGPGAEHPYMVHVGAGWAFARIPWSGTRSWPRMDPLLRWLAVDGVGFHAGYFDWRRAVSRHMVPARLAGYARRVFDQGLGRSLWFVDGADATRIPSTIESFPRERRADLWSGVGLASAYAGPADHAACARLHRAAGPYRPELAQGAAFAAKARQRAGNPTANTERACSVYARMSADDAAAITDASLRDLPADQDLPAYEVWRRRIQQAFIEERMP
jgi:hypothetical protein